MPCTCRAHAHAHAHAHAMHMHMHMHMHMPCTCTCHGASSSGKSRSSRTHACKRTTRSPSSSGRCLMHLPPATCHLPRCHDATMPRCHLPHAHAHTSSGRWASCARPWQGTRGRRASAASCSTQSLRMGRGCERAPSREMTTSRRSTSLTMPRCDLGKELRATRALEAPAPWSCLVGVGVVVAVAVVGWWWLLVVGGGWVVVVDGRVDGHRWERPPGTRPL